MMAQRAARRVPAALVLLTLLFLPAPGSAAKGVLTDPRTGLTWVADPQFAVHTGFATAATMSRARALRFVAEMNRGRFENFGRHDWRLPTWRELAAHAGRPAQPMAGDRVMAWPVAGAASLAGIESVAVFATNSVLLARSTQVQGSVVTNDIAVGPTLQSGFELTVNAQAKVDGAVAAHRLRLDQGSSVSGDASYDLVQGNGAVAGARHTPLALPVFALLPAFQTAAPRAGAPDVIVAAGETRTLSAGDYGLLDVGAHGTLILAGGQYDVRDVQLRDGSGCASPCASLLFAAPTDLRLVERFDVGAASVVAPQTGSGVDAAAVIVYVGGINGTTGALGATPPAAHAGRGAVLGANLLAPNGSVLIDRDAIVRGSLFGRDVRVDQGGRVTLASFFANRPPIAHPQTVVTAGAAPLAITLTGEDPEHQDLRFSIVSGPTQGALGAVVELPPPVLPGDPSRTQASVTYTPVTAGNLEDSFVFQVRDPAGAIGVATVRINPPGQDGGPPPPPTTVVASDLGVDGFRDRPVTVTLTGDAPAGVDLTFAVVAGSGPASGTLSPLVPGTETPRHSSATTYTPAAGFVGTDAFRFTACGVVSAVTVCVTATATITLTEPPVEPSELAPDIGTSTVENRAVQILLGGAAGATSAPAAQRLAGIARTAAVLDGAEIAGNVADADLDGLGDNHNALPGPAPILISAGVGQTGGAGSNGTNRLEIEWDLSGVSATGLTGASVILHTQRGTVDSLPTVFFAGAGCDGSLADSDFEAVLEGTGATMPVPDLSTQPVGQDGTFTFDVLGPLQSALGAGASFFTVQGRVNETAAGPARGLQVRSTASGNLASFLEPQLALTTPGVTPPPTFTVLTLPVHGVLRDGQGALVQSVPAVLSDARLTYTPFTGFSGNDTFDYRAELGAVVDTGHVSITIRAGDCAIDPEFCDSGR